MSVTAASFFLSRVLMIWKDARLYQGSYILILAKFGPPPAGLQCYGDALFQLCLGVSFGGDTRGLFAYHERLVVERRLVSSGSSSALRFALTRGGMDRGHTDGLTHTRVRRAIPTGTVLCRSAVGRPGIQEALCGRLHGLVDEVS